ncbi:23S rRNA pseudouridine(955/2504/2580) synthase RluC [Endozoicomonas sp. SM1973]|uniref:Pseudouridine synthase n=1 Tax=Spartinivicinus marinus TaxID=2994442 RepID=A0A853HUR4_9GAMM|nr:23S rRNA pseudouridine(955/2504/2580) synthase RluC [Spartinivicinus marinus]NYZ65003.1 23S rRNA pseudouridine(955/2504/2580) synthase RluC [Spartinivicinus marinus]
MNLNQTVQYLTIDAEQVGQRLDNWLMARLKGVPKSKIYRIIRKGEVRVNKARVKPEYRVLAGDIVRVPPIRVSQTTPVVQPHQKVLKELEQSILYEDNQLLVLNKPAGLAVHGGSGISYGVIEGLRKLRPDCKGLELVHRLDRDTSGCLLVAKRRSMLRYLHEIIRQGNIDKIYRTVVLGRWPKRRQQIAAPLRKNEPRAGERIVKVDPQGKQALTEFTVLEYYPEVTLVQAKPITGRTHQIRVHAQYAGHPIVGDEKYGDFAINRQLKAVGFNRLCLHAAQLSFDLPDGTPFYVEAPLPESILQPLTQLKSNS